MSGRSALAIFSASSKRPRKPTTNARFWRTFGPAFGCAIHDYVFATNDPTTHCLIRHHVIQALELWEPRIALAEVRVRAAREEPSQVLVEIEYVLRATNERRNLVYPFYIIPGEPEEAA